MSVVKRPSVADRAKPRSAAQRMLRGERPYLDFFQFTPPRRGHILLCPVQGVWTSYLASQRSVSMAGIVLFIWVISTSTRLRRHGLICVWGSSRTARIFIVYRI